MLGAGEGINIDSKDRSHKEDGSSGWTRMLGAGDSDNLESEDG